MRAAVAVLFAVLSVAVGTGGQDKKEEKPAPKLDGTYLLVAVEFDGEKQAEEFVTKQHEAERTGKFAACGVAGNEPTCLRKAVHYVGVLNFLPRRNP